MGGLKYIDEFRDSSLVSRLVQEISNLGTEKQIKIMEVCGTHTMSIRRFGIHKLLPDNVKLISGPGCPVCVTPASYIDTAIKLAQEGNFVIVTFGDMVRVPGSLGCLESAGASGRSVRLVYSCYEALKIAIENPSLKVVFLSIGFETTAPTIAATVVDAMVRGVKNFFILPNNKLIPPAIDALLSSGEVEIGGLLLPGHVTTVWGYRDYEFVPEKYSIPCAVAGFEPVDILAGIKSILMQINSGRAAVENTYLRSVKIDGNEKAKRIIQQVFKRSDSEWRGLGVIPGSGLELRDDFVAFDAFDVFGIEPVKSEENPLCRCGEILKGLIRPDQCPLFKKKCTPLMPYGPCMVSSEGTCAAYYKYGG